MTPTDTKLHAAMYQEAFPDKTVRCLLCPHQCLVREGKQGICRTRMNRSGELVTLAYGNPCSVNMDPIEKKPLFHFFPGSAIYSIATAGCNFRCLNCQNWEISQASPADLRQYELMPDEVVDQALLHRTGNIAFTYTEPTVFYEYMFDTAKLAREKGLKTVMISNGFINEKPLVELCQYLDAANIDLKCFDEAICHTLTGGRLQPVLNTLKTLKEKGVWLEITNLLIPGLSDNPEMITAMCDWLVYNGFSETPLHFSRFFPTYRLPGTAPTPEASLLKAKEIAESSGLNYVYIGNLPGLHGENTFCPDCRQLLIERSGYTIWQNTILEGRCPSCRKPIAGIWS
jgi:pyruvate formate lyase activating enzyme